MRWYHYALLVIGFALVLIPSIMTMSVIVGHFGTRLVPLLGSAFACGVSITYVFYVLTQDKQYIEHILDQFNRNHQE